MSAPTEEVMKLAREIGISMRFELAGLQPREAAALWGKPGIIEAMNVAIALALTADREELEREMANCRANCLGGKVEGVRQWVAKERLDRAEAEIATLRALADRKEGDA